MGGERVELSCMELLSDSGRDLRCAVEVILRAARRDRLRVGWSLEGRWYV